MSDKTNPPILGRRKEELRQQGVGSFIGDPCEVQGDCRAGLVCLQAYGDGDGAYPDGYCSAPCPKHTCVDDAEYMYSRCVQWEHEQEPICMISCGAEGICRPGYFCNRLERSDGGEGVRYVCTPRNLSATTALQRLRDDHGGQAPPSPLSPPSRSTPERAGSNNPEQARDQSASHGTPNRSQPEEATTPGAHAETRQSVAESQPLVVAEPPDNDQPKQESAFPWALTLTVLIGLLAALTLLRFLFGQRTQTIDRFMRRGDDRSALEAVRDREHEESPEQKRQPEVRQRGKNSATRPLRAKIAAPGPSTERETPGSAGTTRVLQREATSTPVAQFTAPAPPAETAAEETEGDTKRTTPAATAPPSEDTRNAEGGRPGETSVDETPSPAPPSRSTTSIATTPRRPADWLEPPNDDEPLMDVARPLAARVWSGARRLQSGRTSHERIVNRVPVWDNIDDFAPPQPFEVVVQLIEELRRHAEEIRRKKGYDRIVYIESDASRTWFRRGNDGSIAINHPPDSFAKPSMAPDIMRRRGFDRTCAPGDADKLSTIHLGRYLLGSAEANAFLPSLAALEDVSRRFTTEEQLLEEMVLEGLSSVQTIALAAQQNTHRSAAGHGTKRTYDTPESRAATTRDHSPTAETVVRPVASEPATSTSQRTPTSARRRLLCPRCAGDVIEGELACGHCGKPLEPLAVPCPVCGEMNLLLAGEKDQACIAPQCGAPLDTNHSPFDTTHLSTLFSGLMSFDDLRRIGALRDEVHYRAESSGRALDIWQLPPEPWSPITEEQRENYGLSPRFALPTEVLEESGARFAVYPHVADATRPEDLTPEELAIELLNLLDEAHEARLRLPALTPDDLFLDESATLCLRFGHRLRGQTTATPLSLPEEFAAPELEHQMIATTASDLYTAALIWKTWTQTSFREDHEAREEFRQLRELMFACLHQDPAQRPASPASLLVRIRRQRRLHDLV